MYENVSMPTRFYSFLTRSQQDLIRRLILALRIILTASQARQHHSCPTPGRASNVLCTTGNYADKALISIKEVSMSSKQSEPVVTMTQAEYDALVLRASGNKLGSLVLLRNQKTEEFWNKQIAQGKATEEDRVVTYTAHSSFYVGEKFWSEIQADIQASPLKRCQVDVSMNQSRFMSHDRLDPEFDANGEPNNNAPTFWLDMSSDFTIETLAQHIERDPDSAYDMSKGAENAVSKGVIAKRNAA